MQKRRPLHGSISDNIYEITSKEIIKVDDFLNAMKRISEDYLRGSVSLDISGNGSGMTDISVSITAKIIKLMLKTAAPGILKIDINTDSDLKITLTPAELPPVRDLAMIMTFAKSAGFKTDRDERSVTFTSKITVTHVLSVYAVSCDDIYEEMREFFAS